MALSHRCLKVSKASLLYNCLLTNFIMVDSRQQVLQLLTLVYDGADLMRRKL